MPNQYRFSTNQKRFSFFSYKMYRFLHLNETFYKISSINSHSIQSYESCCIIISIRSSGFFLGYADSPFIILNQKDNGKLMKCCKLKSFGYFSFCNRIISQTTNDNRFFFKILKFKIFNIFDSLSYTSRRNGLHSCS